VRVAEVVVEHDDVGEMPRLLLLKIEALARNVSCVPDSGSSRGASNSNI
jgi:hypothetical protein